MSCKVVFHRMLSSLSPVTSLDMASINTESIVPSNAKKLSVVLAAAFLAGEMAGSGVLALPKAIADSGWIGILLIFVCCLNTGISGSKLAKCWIIIEERYPEYVKDTGTPYPEIAYRAFGTKMKYTVMTCVGATLFGVSVVLLLLIAQLLQSLLINQIHMSYCYWILIIGLVLLPLTWFGTPKDFWPAAVFAIGSIATACLLIFIQILLDIGKKEKLPPPPVSFQSFVFAFGTILFAFGGAAMFPTIQNDMKDRKQFPKSILITFIILLLLYSPIAISGYAVFGFSVSSDVVQNLTQGPVTKIIQCLLIAHMFFAFIIALNPFNQQIEDGLKISREGFNWKRYLFRSVVVLAVIFVALSVPHFGNILALIGGSCVTMLTFLFPPLFYMRLCKQKNIAWPEITLSLHERVYLMELILIAVLGGCASTWGALTSIVSSPTFTTPCYVNPEFHCYVDPNSNC